MGSDDVGKGVLGSEGEGRRAFQAREEVRTVAQASHCILTLVPNLTALHGPFKSMPAIKLAQIQVDPQRPPGPQDRIREPMFSYSREISGCLTGVMGYSCDNFGLASQIGLSYECVSPT